MLPGTLTRLTLEPLRNDGPAALDPTGLPNVRRVDLTELGVVSHNVFCDVRTLTGHDLFAPNPGHPDQGPIPETGTLTYACFQVRFADSDDTDFIEIHLPHTLTFGPRCDALTFHPWLAQHGFALPPDEDAPQIPILAQP